MTSSYSETVIRAMTNHHIRARAFKRREKRRKSIMLYKDFKGLKLSTLGLGNMRLPKTGEGEKIDEAPAREIIEYAYHNGVNYYDTAFRYHGGESEIFVGKVMEQFPRESFYLATKIPGHMMTYQDGKYNFTNLLAGWDSKTPEQIFQEQLEKCRTNYFDFYLLHNVCEHAWDFYTNPEIRMVEYLLEKKKAGQLRHLGFSTHAEPETIDAYLTWAEEKFGYQPFEFVQPQINYLDWTLQNASEKYAILEKRGIAVIVMEGCRGGRLASLGPESDAMLKNARPDDSIAKWAFRFLQTLPAVQVVLSGMTTLDQLKENISTFSQNDPLSGEEKKLLREAIKPLLDLVPCTSCRYCTEACPNKLDIPHLISMYNEAKNDGMSGAFHTQITAMKDAELPAACVACGACKRLCPQNIDIPGVMKQSERFIRRKSVTI
jgi:predicted aldo/keto reductase-like oxidoreductase